jgi:SNF2 family DNA or RNA helicase
VLITDLFNKSASADAYKAMMIAAQRRWCVTATPFTTSLGELGMQASFLGAVNGSSSLRNFISGSVPREKKRFLHGVDVLKEVMIRHTKSQRINGVSALSLPESTTTVVYISMSDKERRLYSDAKRDISFGSALSHGAKAFYLEQKLLYRLTMNTLLSSPIKLERSSKIQTLVNELGQLLREDPSCKVVVFTQYKATQYAVISAVKQIGMNTLNFSGNTSAPARDEAIRSFQRVSGPATVFVITIKAGSVGMTLTAASRVYLVSIRASFSFYLPPTRL